jgi:type II secretory pathway pseudopilin PulG
MSTQQQGKTLSPHRGVAVLVLGILGLFVFPVAIVAWVMGNTDRKKIRAGEMNREGEGLTLAGYVLGIIGTVFMGITFLGITLSVALPAFLRTSGEARTSLAQARMRAIQTALDQRYMETERYAHTLDELVSDGAIAAKELTDPWGARFLYVPDKSADGSILRYELSSLGPDGKRGTEDDIPCETCSR